MKARQAEQAIADRLQAAAHPDVAQVDTYAARPAVGKFAGVRVQHTNGAVNVLQFLRILGPGETGRPHPDYEIPEARR